MSRAEYLRDWRKANPAASAGYSRRWRGRFPKRASASDRDNHLKKYGLSSEQYQQMLEKQRGLCAICKRPPRGRNGQLCVDHCHTSGQVRGLLCHQCNVALGLLAESKKFLRAAIRYLEKA